MPRCRPGCRPGLWRTAAALLWGAQPVAVAEALGGDAGVANLTFPTYLVTNCALRAFSPGLGYRGSPRLADRLGPAAFAPWGSNVAAVLEKGGTWIRTISGQYLPTKVNGQPVVVPAASVKEFKVCTVDSANSSIASLDKDFKVRTFHSSNDSFVSMEQVTHKRHRQVTNKLRSGAATVAAAPGGGAKVCPAGYYEATPLLWVCGGGTHSGHFQLSLGTKTKIEVPANIAGFSLDAEAPVLLGFEVMDAANQGWLFRSNAPPQQEGLVTYTDLVTAAGGHKATIRFVNKTSDPLNIYLLAPTQGSRPIAAKVMANYTGIVPCPPQPLGCQQLDSVAVGREVKEWSCWVTRGGASPLAAWAAATHQEGSLLPARAVPRRDWEQLWHKWEGGRRSDWRPAFALLDANQDSQVSQAEFAKGLELCRDGGSTKPKPGAAVFVQILFVLPVLFVAAYGIYTCSGTTQHAVHAEKVSEGPLFHNKNAGKTYHPLALQPNPPSYEEVPEVAHTPQHVALDAQHKVEGPPSDVQRAAMRGLEPPEKYQPRPLHNSALTYQTDHDAESAPRIDNQRGRQKRPKGCDTCSNSLMECIGFRSGVPAASNATFQEAKKVFFAADQG